MVLYRYADFTISSNMPLKELSIDRRVDIQVPDFQFSIMISPPEVDDSSWLHQWQTDKDVSVLCLAKTGDSLLLRFPGLADFVIAFNGSRIIAWPFLGTDDETLRHLLLDQVMPRVLSHRGCLVLHAGAIDLNGRVIALIGETGAGKSTMTASFHTAGFLLFADDGLVMTPCEDGVFVRPNYCGLRLWPDSIPELFETTPDLAPMAHYSTKQRIMIGQHPDKPKKELPLSAIYVLEPRVPMDPAESASVFISRLSPADACMAVITNTFQMDVTDHHRAATLLDTASSVVQRVPVFSLEFSHDFDSLPDVRKKIIQHQETHVPGRRQKHLILPGELAEK